MLIAGTLLNLDRKHKIKIYCAKIKSKQLTRKNIFNYFYPLALAFKERIFKWELEEK